MATKKKESCSSQCGQTVTALSISVSIVDKSTSETIQLSETVCPRTVPKSSIQCNTMVEEVKNEEKHETDDEHEHTGLLGSISKAVAEAEDLLSSIKIKDDELANDNSSETGDDSVLSYYGYDEDDELSLEEELENLDDLEKDLALKLRRAEEHAIMRAERRQRPQVVRPPGEGKGRRARARNARERREREALENGEKGIGKQTADSNQGAQEGIVVRKHRPSISRGKDGGGDDYDNYSQSSSTQHPCRPPFEGKGRRARARRARERRESQEQNPSEADDEAVQNVQTPPVAASGQKKLNPAAPSVSPPFEGTGRRARARRAKERWANSQCDNFGYSYQGAMPVTGEIQYYQH